MKLLQMKRTLKINLNLLTLSKCPKMTFILQTRVESEFDQTQKMTGEGPME